MNLIDTYAEILALDYEGTDTEGALDALLDSFDNHDDRAEVILLLEGEGYTVYKDE